jgi:hypothetical protein
MRTRLNIPFNSKEKKAILVVSLIYGDVVVENAEGENK